MKGIAFPAKYLQSDVLSVPYFKIITRLCRWERDGFVPCDGRWVNCQAGTKYAGVFDWLGTLYNEWSSRTPNGEGIITPVPYYSISEVFNNADDPVNGYDALITKMENV